MHVFMKHCFSSKRMLFPLLTLILPLHYDFALYITDFFKFLMNAWLKTK